MQKLALLFWFWRAAAAFGAAEVIPPAPTAYFNDYAHVVSPGAADDLDQKLRAFEQATSNQIVVAIYPTMQTDSSLEDYTQRVATAWKVGNKKLNNGAVLFVFVQEHKLRIEVGYGLEGAIPDGTAWDILENRMRPLLRQGNYDGALEAGVDALMKASKGEYKGTGKTVAQGQQAKGGGEGGIILLVILFLIFMAIQRRGMTYSGSGFWQGMLIGSFMGGGGGGGGGGGWSGGGGGGGFSGGGGGFGGGGASGGW